MAKLDKQVLLASAHSEDEVKELIQALKMKGIKAVPSQHSPHEADNMNDIYTELKFAKPPYDGVILHGGMHLETKMQPEQAIIEMTKEISQRNAIPVFVMDEARHEYADDIKKAGATYVNSRNKSPEQLAFAVADNFENLGKQAGHKIG